ALLVVCALLAVPYRVALLAGLASFAVHVLGGKVPLIALVVTGPLAISSARRRVLGLAAKIRPAGVPAAARGPVRAAAIGAALAVALLLIWNPIVALDETVRAGVAPIPVA